MSRCFPYPPPGYVKKARNDARRDHGDSLAKVKQKEKKHKKERTDKEKSKDKRKEDKELSQDEHKEKNNKKEKHKDKKKDKGVGRTSEDETEKPIQSHHEDRLEGRWKTKETNHCKLSDELDHQIKMEEKVSANRVVDNFPSSVQRSSDVSGSKAAKVMERVSSNKVIPASMDSLTSRTNGMGRPADRVLNSIRSQTEVLGSANAIQRERNAANKLVSNLTHLEQTGDAGKSQPVNNSRVSIQQKSDGPYVASMGKKENCKQNKALMEPSSTMQRSFNGLSRSAENTAILAHGNVDGIGLTKTLEDRGETKKFVPNNIFIEQREQDGISRAVEKDADKRIERKEKNTEEEAYGRKVERHKNRCWDKKDKSKLEVKGKDQEKSSQNCERKHKEYDEIRDMGKKVHMDIPNPELIASAEDQKSSNTHENKKRKELEMNGHENNLLPNKFQRTTASDLVANGKIVNLSHNACSSMNSGALDNSKAGKHPVDKKEHITKDIKAVQPSSDGLMHPAVMHMKPPHPDSKYLDEMYSVPKMDDYPEYDDQDWLFCRSHLHSNPRTKLEADERPQVWAKAIGIGSENVVALPYVIPF
ncbi:hypothetical protein MUK42_26574 [Musa troglodytarum]|uniref:Uncharacterized protein n=3 Tax=Musa troglodytarum TaxID=320322 RepID=A0A9E7F7G7_9LILI|nr:hypothetical protein MUK42_26574 [Musa troglodytarum]URD89038.1 hypothetical protein MUK42_26574 [Musa troglodytarum]